MKLSWTAKLLVRGLWAVTLYALALTYASEETTTDPMYTDELDSTIFLEWSADMSTMYPPSSPLEVELGDELIIMCPDDGISNIWIQSHQEQYDQCKCNVSGVNLTESSCDPHNFNTKNVCQDEIQIRITSVSQTTDTLRGFLPNTTYYFMSFSPGVKSLDGYSSNSEGGECLEGFKMVMYVLPIEKATTAIPTTVPTTSTLATTTGESLTVSNDATDSSTSDEGITQYTNVMDNDLVNNASPGMTGEKRDASPTILIAAIIPALLLALAIVAILVAIVSIVVCKNMRGKKQNYYIDPCSLPETNADRPDKLEIYHNESTGEIQTTNAVYGVNAMATTDQDVGKFSLDLSPEQCQDIMLNPSYGANEAIAE